jgi:hypothetical protein
MTADNITANVRTAWISFLSSEVNQVDTCRQLIADLTARTDNAQDIMPEIITVASLLGDISNDFSIVLDTLGQSADD